MNTYKLTIHMADGESHQVLWIDAKSRAHAVKQAAQEAIAKLWSVAMIEVEE